MFAAALLALVVAAPAPQPSFTPSPQRILGLIRAKFRSHRPPPPYEIYTMARKQNTDRGFPDYEESYTYRIWVRNVDRAALARKVLIAPAMGFAEFQRPAFNEDRDPGPPTADLFEPAPAHPRPISEVPTPEPTNGPQYQTIGSVSVIAESDYHVDSIATEGTSLHLVVTPIRDPERNRIREIYCDKTTYELQRIILHDRLFDENDNKVYEATFDTKLALLDGVPVVTSIHGVVGNAYGSDGKLATGNDYAGDGKIVDYTFTKISFPATLPDWYFDAKQYAQHEKELPSQ
jgi:hypothetical protein